VRAEKKGASSSGAHRRCARRRARTHLSRLRARGGHALSQSYVVEGGGQNRRGEVIQELRWQLTPQGWKIFSERDVRVIR
jgi:hypothetical protein